VIELAAHGAVAHENEPRIGELIRQPDGDLDKTLGVLLLAEPAELRDERAALRHSPPLAAVGALARHHTRVEPDGDDAHEMLAYATRDEPPAVVLAEHDHAVEPFATLHVDPLVEAFAHVAAQPAVDSRHPDGAAGLRQQHREVALVAVRMDDVGSLCPEDIGEAAGERERQPAPRLDADPSDAGALELLDELRRGAPCAPLHHRNGDRLDPMSNEGGQSAQDVALQAIARRTRSEQVDDLQGMPLRRGQDRESLLGVSTILQEPRTAFNCE